MHESGGSFEKGNYSEGGGSSWSSMGGRHESLERVERNIREERRERHGRRGEEPMREKIDMAKCKIPQLLGNCKLSVEEYHKEMEMNLMRAQVRESEKATIARFLHRLNREIQDVVELKHYGTLGEFFHQAIKETTSTPTPMAPRTSNIKCFKFLGKGHIASQCSNRRVMIVKDDKEIESESSLRKLSSTSEAESHSDCSHSEGDFLVVRRLMNNHVGEDT
ncbi:hypothetical protein CR513_01875, partial [Mucuna pruriens]